LYEILLEEYLVNNIAKLFWSIDLIYRLDGKLFPDSIFPCLEKESIKRHLIYLESFPALEK
jgi:hypothetical protein